jgi:hypothetical protein
MNDLAKYDDSRYQAEIFGIMLSEQEHFAQNDLEKEASAQVCSWDEFEVWLNKKTKQETTHVVNGSQHDIPVKTNSAYTLNGTNTKVPVIETVGNGSPRHKNKSSKWYQRNEPEIPKETEPDRKRSFPLSFSLGKKGSKYSLRHRKS